MMKAPLMEKTRTFLSVLIIIKIHLTVANVLRAFCIIYNFYFNVKYSFYCKTSKCLIYWFLLCLCFICYTKVYHQQKASFITQLFRIMKQKEKVKKVQHSHNRSFITIIRLQHTKLFCLEI